MLTMLTMLPDSAYQKAADFANRQTFDFTGPHDIECARKALTMRKQHRSSWGDHAVAYLKAHYGQRRGG